MPFTFSHPAVVLPLAYLPRRWFSMTGLVIGSLTPDFEYFIRMRIQSDYSHGISGMFWFDLPLGILLAFIFHNIVRDSLCDNLPTMLKSRFFDFTTFNWKEYFKSNWVVVIISVLIGTGSHILWDGFTHGHGYFVTTYSTLTETIDVFDVPIPVYKISQHSSTLIGGIVILIAIFKLPQNEKVKGFLNLKYWGTLATITMTIFVIRFLFGLNFQEYGNVIVTGISSGLIALMLTPSIVFHLFKRKSNIKRA